MHPFRLVTGGKLRRLPGSMKVRLVLLALLAIAVSAIVGHRVATTDAASMVLDAHTSTENAFLYVSGRIHLPDADARVGRADTGPVKFRMIRLVAEPRRDALAKDKRTQALIKQQGLTSAYTVTIEDRSDMILFQRTLVVDTASHEPLSSLAFSELLPWPVDAAFLRIKLRERILAERQPSPNRPLVVINKFDSKQSQEGPLTIQWRGEDLDGDPLVYDIFYSPDGGRGWRALALNYKDTTFTLKNTDDLPGSDRGMIRVRAADGFNTSSDDHPITVANKPPLAFLLSPADGRNVIQGKTVVLQAEVIDLEEGPLRDDSLSWRSDIDGPLGNGPDIATRELSVGSHRITLTATDSTGMTSRSSVALTVSPSETPQKPPRWDEMIEILKRSRAEGSR